MTAPGQWLASMRVIVTPSVLSSSTKVGVFNAIGLYSDNQGRYKPERMSTHQQITIPCTYFFSSWSTRRDFEMSKRSNLLTPDTFSFFFPTIIQSTFAVYFVPQEHALGVTRAYDRVSKGLWWEALEVIWMSVCQEMEEWFGSGGDRFCESVYTNRIGQHERVIRSSWWHR